MGAGLVALAVFNGAGLAATHSQTASAWIYIAIGLLLFALAAWAWRRGAREPDETRESDSAPRGRRRSTIAEVVMESADQTGATAVGRRDLAVVALLVRLGLRAGEVARLKLDDVDWRAGEIVVVGKGPRLERLPLPNDVGEAIVDYVREARPRVRCRALFLRSLAPLVGLSSAGVTAIVVRAGTRAGLAPIGPHRLRHTAATEMLRTGASLPDIGRVLRHRRLQSTRLRPR
jgi:integrase